MNTIIYLALFLFCHRQLTTNDGQHQMFDVAVYVQDTQVAKGKLTLAEERG
jgi:hypothetical protein